MLRISIIGARRNRNGIGEYIGKYFQKARANVVSVLGTSAASSRLAALGLQKYGIEAAPHTDFERMVEKERPHAVVIASPPGTHYEYLIKSIDRGLHIFCEKPLIWPVGDEPRKTVEEILKRAEKKKLTVAMNTQLPFTMVDYERLCGKIEPRDSNHFFIGLSPTFAGNEMIPDSMPHALSLLYFQFGEGRLSNLSYEASGPDVMDIRFKYLTERSGCEVYVKLVRKEEQPRDFQFGFNGRIVTRRLDLTNYDISFAYGDHQIKILDPLERSVNAFLEAVKEKKEPFMGYTHILNNMSLLKEIYDGCLEIEKRSEWRN